MAERQIKPLSVNSFAVKISVNDVVLDKFFSKCSAIKKTYNSSTYSDGTSNTLYSLPGSIQYDDVTLSKPLIEDDGGLIKALLAANTKPNGFVTVDIQAVYRDGYFQQDIGANTTLKYCTVKSVSLSEIDTAGDGVSMLEVVLSPGHVLGNGGKKFWQEAGGEDITTSQVTN
jgi:hypothetical protein